MFAGLVLAAALGSGSYLTYFLIKHISFKPVVWSQSRKHLATLILAALWVSAAGIITVRNTPAHPINALVLLGSCSRQRSGKPLPGCGLQQTDRLRFL